MHLCAAALLFSCRMHYPFSRLFSTVLYTELAQGLLRDNLVVNWTRGDENMGTCKHLLAGHYGKNCVHTNNFGRHQYQNNEERGGLALFVTAMNGILMSQLRRASS